MEERTSHTRRCPLCGKEIHYEIISDDGSDWCGHQRGHSSSQTIGCECECDKVKFKRMCFNCCYYNESSNICSNKEVVEEYKLKIENDKSPFKIDKLSIKIKKPTNSCKEWTLDADIASSIFK